MNRKEVSSVNQKTSTKNDGKKRYSKSELLDIMNDHLEQQQKIAEKLKQKAESFIEEESSDKEAKKQRNSYLFAYNQQVDAVSKTSSMLLKIYNSTIDLNEEDEEDSLID